MTVFMPRTRFTIGCEGMSARQAPTRTPPQPAAAQDAAIAGGVWNLGKVTPPTLLRVHANARQFGRLDAAFAKPVIWIHGPPGAGKTTLAASYLAGRGIDPLWYRLDQGDADPATLFVYLAAARPRGRLHLPRLTPEYRTALPLFARRFFGGLLSCPRTHALVFDDYHEIAPGAVVHDCFAAGLEEVPSGRHVVVVSRAPPPPQLARMRINGLVEVVEPEALRITIEEAEGLARARASRTDRAGLDRIVRRAQGWTAGIILMLEADGPTSPAAPASEVVSEIMFDYFAGEVLRRFEPRVQRLLCALALMPTTTVAAAVRLTGEADAGAVLEDLRRRNYFTARDASAEPSYRFHPLFRDFLLGSAPDHLSGEALDRLRLRAAAVLGEIGQWDAAVALLAEAGAWPELVATIQRWAPVLEREGRVQTLSGWLDRLPPGTVAAHGWLSYWAGCARMGARPSESRPHFDRARALFDQASDQRGLLLSWAARTEAIRFDPFADNSELDALVAEMADILRRDPTYPSPEVEMRVATGMYVALERRMTDHPEREAWRMRALALARLHPQGGRLELIAFGVVVYDVMAGRFASARKLFDELPEPSSLEHVPFAQQLAYFAQAYLQAEGHFPGEPSATAQIAVDAALRSGTLYWLHFSLAMAALQAQNNRDLSTSARWIATIRTLLGPELLRRSAHHHSVLAGHDLLAGRFEAARLQAETGVEVAVASGWYFHEAWARLRLAEALRAGGAVEEAEGQLAEAEGITARCGLRTAEFARLLLVANLHFARGRGEEGFTTLETAFRLGRETDVRRFNRMQAAVAPLCARALAAGIEVDYVRDLVRANALEAPDPDVAAWPWPLRITTFGGLRIEREGEPLSFSGKVPKRLISLLKAIIAHGGSEIADEKLVDAVWPDEDGDAGHRALTIAIHRLRKLLGGSGFVSVRGGRVGLDPTRCWLDVWAFERGLARRAPAETEAGYRARIERGLALYRGAFLADDDPWWTIEARDRLSEAYVRGRRALTGRTG